MSKLKITDEYSRKVAIDFISRLNVDKPWTMKIERQKKKRTLNQNALYWQWVTIIGDHLGNFKDDMHEILKEDHMTPKIVIFQEEEREVRSIKNLSTKEMSVYMDRVSLWANADMGIYLPMPIDKQRNQ